MFFRLINSLAISQAMIDELLRDLINTGKVKSFIDDVMVGIESKEKHNELVKEILMKIEENLYMKPEKYKWKVREVDFLRVVIKPEEIKMVEEKLKAMLNWPVSKLVKEV